LRACGVALAGIALMGLIVLTALQPVAQSGRLRVDSFALARDLGSASAAVASPSSSGTNAASASSSTAASTPGATAPSTFAAAPTVPTPLPVLIVRIPPTAPTGTSSSGGDVEAIITAAAQAAGVAPSWLISTAACESGLNPNAYNGAGPYEGLFQFLPSTFRAHGGTNIWDPAQQAQIAATMFASGESGEWPVCSR
jgi:soluble lytic murein transglycosylase-like protein